MKLRYETINRLEAVWRSAQRAADVTDGSPESIQFAEYRWDRLIEEKERLGLCLAVGCREKSERAYCEEHDEQKNR